MPQIPDTNPAETTETVTEAIRTHMVTNSDSIDETLTTFANVLLPVYSGITLRVTVTQATKTADIVPVPDDPTSKLAEIASLDADTGGDPPDYLIRIRPPSPNMGQLPPAMARSTAIYTQLKWKILHEVLHAMKTDITTIQDRLTEEVEQPYHEYAHECWNALEDAAIETSVCVQPGFPQPLENDLLLGRRADHTPVDSETTTELTAPQAIQSLLLEWGLPHYRHVTQFDRPLNQYLDSNAAAYAFDTPADRRVTEELFPELVELVNDAIGTVHPPTDSRHDLLASKQASRRRADLFLDAWTHSIKPALTDTGPSGTASHPARSESNGQTRNSNSGFMPAESARDTNSDEAPDQATSDSETAATEDTSPVPDSADSCTESHDSESHPDATVKTPPSTENTGPVLDANETVRTPPHSPTSQPPQAPEEFGEKLTETATSTDHQQSGSQPNAADYSPAQPDSETDSQSPQKPGTDEQASASATDSVADASQHDSSTVTAPTHTESESTITDADMREQAAANNRDVTDMTMCDPRSAGHSIAEALADGTQDMAEPDLTGTGSGDGALAGINILPKPDNTPINCDWQAIRQHGTRVAAHLSDVLDQSRNDATRRGMTGGSYDASQAYKSASGAPGQFKRPLPGEKKRYCLVICIDRSGSMSNGIDSGSNRSGRLRDDPEKIELATRCASQLSWGAEDVGIDVAVIDFCNDECRLIKPPEVPTTAVKRRLLSTDAHGATPLSDALRLANTLTESRSNTPLIVSISDDNPDSARQTKKALEESTTLTGSIRIRSESNRDHNNTLSRAFDTTEEVSSESELQEALLRFISAFGRIA